MRFILFLAMTLLSGNVFAIGCDCEVRVYSPLTGSYQMKPNSFRVYELEEYSTYSRYNQAKCKASCLERFEEDMPAERLNALLLTYAQSLISEGALGYNCTGLTTLKFPVRVKASLGTLGLGNIADVVQVVNYEQLCF